jgi:dipeptidyl aminopeptidase/acylaminoacyl peptidase
MEALSGIGGPRPGCGARERSVYLLLARGYAVFHPNPRGSSGRGQDYIRRVVGDMGGSDTHDFLSGIDHLVGEGIADPSRLGVTGGSYGGFMTSWLITQDSRFRAAVPFSPVTNQVTQHLIGNIPQFSELFLQDRYDNSGGSTSHAVLSCMRATSERRR